MHDVDFADVLGKKPVVLLFATPALCQSRVCGPVVDVAEQVKRDRPDDAAFIHMEIYNDNDPNKGLRPQLAAFNLPTEPWLFVDQLRRHDLDPDRGRVQRQRAQRGPRQGPLAAPRAPRRRRPRPGAASRRRR